VTVTLRSFKHLFADSELPQVLISVSLSNHDASNQAEKVVVMMVRVVPAATRRKREKKGRIIMIVTKIAFV
jgi:hypothetical protein